MQPQIITNKPGQARPTSTHRSSRTPLSGSQAGNCSGRVGERGLIPTNTPATGSKRSHRDKGSFHMNHTNGINPSAPLKGWQEKTQSSAFPPWPPLSSSPGTRAERVSGSKALAAANDALSSTGATAAKQEPLSPPAAAATAGAWAPTTQTRQGKAPASRLLAAGAAPRTAKSFRRAPRCGSDPSRHRTAAGALASQRGLRGGC